MWLCWLLDDSGSESEFAFGLCGADESLVDWRLGSVEDNVATSGVGVAFEEYIFAWADAKCSVEL